MTTGWLKRLAEAAGSRPRVATVTPLSNNATLCSVPVPFADNPLPGGYEDEDMARLIAAVSLRVRPEAPTGVGFCMYVTRTALEAVGGFDTARFGRGYGEENDFCQRALAKGFVNLIADDAYVWHEGGASFGPADPTTMQRAVGRGRGAAPRLPGIRAAVLPGPSPGSVPSVPEPLCGRGPEGRGRRRGACPAPAARRRRDRAPRPATWPPTPTLGSSIRFCGAPRAASAWTSTTVDGSCAPSCSL